MPRQLTLFVSYRHEDSSDAAHRVALMLERKFGAGSVFIDTELPSGQRWEEAHRGLLNDCHGVVVIVGNQFLELLEARSRLTDGSPDYMVKEIAMALERDKQLYPVLCGPSRMPKPQELPDSIRALAGFQAQFARDPSFDAAIETLIKAIAANSRWQGDADEDDHKPPQGPQRPLTLGLWALALLTLLWGAGRLILWLAQPASGPPWPDELAFWHGARYALATCVWGLGPYLAYWMVAEVRARASLPIFDEQGILAGFIVGGILVAGGSFLLLSTLPRWELRPFLVDRLLATLPQAWQYVVLALLLLCIAVGSVLLATGEPKARQMLAEGRGWLLRAINVLSIVWVGLVAWFLASLAVSLRWPPDQNSLPVVGYFLLCPALSLLMAGWGLARSQLGLNQGAWQFRFFFWLVAGLYLMCTLALFAYGPTPVLAANA